MESLNPTVSLWRAQIVFVLVITGAIFGTCTWLVPEHLFRLAACCMLGLLVPLSYGHWQVFIVNNAVKRLKVSRAAQNSYWAEGLFTGMLGLSAPLLFTFAITTAIEYLGASFGFEQGHWLALAVFCLGMCTSLPYNLTVETLRPLACLARRTAYLVDSLRVDDGQRRLARVEEALDSVASQATSAQTQAAIGLPMFAAFMTGMLSKSSIMNHPEPGNWAALYICPIALFIPLALVSQSSLRAGKAVTIEVRRQFSVFPQEAGVVRVPADFTPSYRSCVDLAARESGRRLGLLSSASLAIPLIFGLVVSWMGKNPALLSEGFALYLMITAVAVSATGFALEAANDFAHKAGNRAPRSADSPRSAASLCAVHHLAIHATPLMRISAKATVLVALAFSTHVF